VDLRRDEETLAADYGNLRRILMGGKSVDKPCMTVEDLPSVRGMDCRKVRLRVFYTIENQSQINDFYSYLLDIQFCTAHNLISVFQTQRI
jgi:hypothetical protein